MKVNIFDYYDDNAKELLQTLSTAGINHKNLFVHYNGELPEGGVSPFTFFTQQENTKNKTSSLFFNQVPVPSFYAIRHVDGRSANIDYLTRLVGKIYYRKEGYRLVDRVEWFSTLASQMVVKTDYYNRIGQHYSSTYFTTDGAYKTEYYDVNGDTIIIEDLAHRSIQLYYKQRMHHFENLTKFFFYFLKVAKINISSIYINSLSYPLFISRALEIGNKTTLFWQEPLGEGIPGNMQNELKSSHTLKQIIFMKEEHLKRVVTAFPTTSVSLNYLSALGEFRRENKFKPQAFILTHSDNIYGLKDILQNFPDLQITVAAFTNMSTKLLHLEEEFKNITLIPSINEEQLSKELEKADIYLDINHGLKVGNILEKVYQEQMIIFSYKAVVQPRTKSLIFENIQELLDQLVYILESHTNWSYLLTQMIERDGKKSTTQDYISTLKIL